MFAKIKMWIGGLLAGVIAYLWVRLKLSGAERDKARRERDIARSAKEAMDAADEAGKRVQEASNEAIRKNNEARQRRADKPADQRFTGRVDTSRLRDPD